MTPRAIRQPHYWVGGERAPTRSWWEAWADLVSDNAGKQISAASELGSDGNKPLGAAAPAARRPSPIRTAATEGCVVRAAIWVGQPPPQCVFEGYRAIHRRWIEAGPGPTWDEVMSSAQR